MADVFGALCMPGIVSGLHPGPDSRPVAKKLAEPNRYGRGYWLSFLQDVVKMLARNSEQSGDLRLGPTGGWDDVIPKHRTGMRRAAIPGALCRIGHICSFNGIVRSRRHTKPSPCHPESLTGKAINRIRSYLSSLRGAKRRSNPLRGKASWIASLRSQ